MTNSQQPTSSNTHEEDKEKKFSKDQTESIKQAKNDSSVKDALKKENSPTTLEDLSSLHDTTSIGTSGGDQRASQDELTEKE